MPVDVTATAAIGRPREEVAAYLRDPANDTSWIGGLRSARLLTPGPVAVGSRVERVASFLGRRVEYVNEVTELTADRLAMRSVRSPFPMRVTYGHRPASDASDPGYLEKRLWRTPAGAWRRVNVHVHVAGGRKR